MDKKDLLELFKETYYKELEVKEKFETRVQLFLAAYVTSFAAIAYMMNAIEATSEDTLLLFNTLTGVSMILILISVPFITTSRTRKEYALVSSPSEVDEFRQKTISQNKNKNLKSVDEEVLDHLYKEYKECSTKNRAINKKIKIQFNTGEKLLTKGLILIFLSGIIFIGNDLDASSPRKAILIQQNNPIKLDDETLNAIKNLYNTNRETLASETVEIEQPVTEKN